MLAMWSPRDGAGDASQGNGSGDMLRQGDRGAAVVEIRAALAAHGLLESSDDDLTTGRQVALDNFDAELDQAVRAFQLPPRAGSSGSRKGGSEKSGSGKNNCEKSDLKWK